MLSRLRASILLVMMPTTAPLALAGEGLPEVPATRPELKAFLEASKKNVPRLPMPELSEADREKMSRANWSGADWSVYNNGRTRKFYLPPELADVSNLRADDPAMTLGPRFQTMLFWIVSRANNCTYCMGHQESKLAALGMVDDQVAELDGSWSRFTEKDKAAFEFARKLTYQPHRIRDDDIKILKRYYSDVQVLEIINAVANFNAMNRWTGALRIPQEEHRAYLTPTSEKHRDALSRQAPLDLEHLNKSGKNFARPSNRPALEPRGVVEEALADCREREPRLALESEAKAQDVTGCDSNVAKTEWAQLLAAFPKSGRIKVTMHVAAETKGKLAPLLRAQIAWIAARNDRSWYALGHAKARLAELGQDEKAIFALDQGDFEAYPPASRAVFSLTRKLTDDPALVEDADIANLREHFSDKEVAEIVFQITEAAYFDRLTEAAGLRLEE
ncbi:carboxymuconolactone decarboxylase family protein [Singulisphaera sp. PoT]|uniref:carboxymuconolactone decarboxylase family protein n=1 Tax=Singulisphaera sp. PoT TaxID=3411797 RepID=UPI003BF5ECAD